MARYVDVAVPLGVRKTFVYSVPERLQTNISIGIRVLIPFARKILSGIVTFVRDAPPPGAFKIRPIQEVLDPFPLLPAPLVDTALWAADYYFAPPGEMLRAAFPAGTGIAGTQRICLANHTVSILSGGMRSPAWKRQENSILDVVQSKRSVSMEEITRLTGLRDAHRWVESLAAAGWVELKEVAPRPRVSPKKQLGIRMLLEAAERLKGLPERQRGLCNMLKPGGDPTPLRPLLRTAGVTLAIARALERKGIVEIEGLRMSRLPFELSDTTDVRSHILSSSQQKALDELKVALFADAPRRFLLHGVTGSGKTEIYLRLMAEVVKNGYGALLLVPEIGLTPLLSRIAVSHFPERVAILHSAMSPGERLDQWDRIRTGEAPVVVGTRSAVFAPLDKLRLIIVDEEQDSSYKQDESPTYHAREVAWQRVQQSRGLLLLGSATPSVESFYHARDLGDTEYLRLPERIQARPMAEVTVVDMSVEFQRYGGKSVISHLLRQELRECLQRGEQSLVLLNRRGYSRILLCRGCGHAFTCPHCSIPMTYHRSESRMICHYCATEAATPSACVNCHGEYIYFVGTGTEQLEEVLRSTFPEARIARLDRDTTRRRGSLRKVLLDFASRRLDMLIGTQMIAKGHDFPYVTLVGVVGADAGLSFPDFRSAERTFQLLTQVAGRAGRGDAPGKVVIQSFYPDHYALRFSKHQDFVGFFRHELEFRRQMGYPPFTRLIQILVADASSARALSLAQTIADSIRSHSREHGLDRKIRILGPATAPLEKLRGKYRFQLLMKSDPDCRAVEILREVYDALGARRFPLKKASIDVDPLSLL